MGRLSSRRGTLADIALSHFSNVRHSSRQRYPSLSLEHTRRLWWSSTLEYSTSFSHGNCPFNWHSRSCCVIGFTGCILLGDVASLTLSKGQGLCFQGLHPRMCSESDIHQREKMRKVMGAMNH